MHGFLPSSILNESLVCCPSSWMQINHRSSLQRAHDMSGCTLFPSYPWTLTLTWSRSAAATHNTGTNWFLPIARPRLADRQQVAFAMGLCSQKPRYPHGICLWCRAVPCHVNSRQVKPGQVRPTRYHRWAELPRSLVEVGGRANESSKMCLCPSYGGQVLLSCERRLLGCASSRWLASANAVAQR